MINVDMVKAKDIAHNQRRAARTAEFAPLDIQATIPMYADQAEQQRQVIRDKYVGIQTNIDLAANVDELKTAIQGFTTNP